MATSATALLGLALPVTGELSGTWGDTVNDSLTALLDTAVSGTTTLSSDADVTLTTTTLAANQARQAIILWTAGGTVTRNITAPAQSKPYIVINKTSSTQSIVLRGAGPTTGVTIIAGEKCLVAWNGVDFVKVSSNSSFGVPVVISGTTTDAALRITQLGTGNALLVEDSSNPDSTPFVITAAGDVGIGTTNIVGSTLGTNGKALSLSIESDINGNSASNSITAGTKIISLSSITGSNGYTAASLGLHQPGSVEGIGDFRFSTGDGAGVLTERTRIDSNGNLLIGTTTSPAGSKELVLGGDYIEGVVAIGTVTSTNTIALTNGTVQTATLTASTACTFTMPSNVAGKSFVLLLKQAAATGNGTATFTSVKWGSSGAPTITATAGKMDILTFIADGTNWYGSAAQGYTP